MSATRPTAWPTVFPPQGGDLEVAAIARYMNEPILAARVALQERQRAAGEPVANDEQAFEKFYLPTYPLTGWRTLGGGIPPYQIIGPSGVGGFGLHEFQGYPEIWTRVYEMQALANNQHLPPVPAPAPQPPPVQPPAPAPPPVDPGGLPPGTPPPVVVPGDLDIAQFANGVRLKLEINDTRFPNQTAAHVRWITSATVGFYYTDPENIEVVAKVIDGRGFNLRFWVFSSGMTDVGVTLVAEYAGAVKRYQSEQGKPYPTTLDTSAF